MGREGLLGWSRRTSSSSLSPTLHLSVAEALKLLKQYVKPPIVKMPSPVYLISKVGDPIFALFIGLSAAATRITREEKEMGRSTQQTLDAGLRYTSPQERFSHFFLSKADSVMIEELAFLDKATRHQSDIEDGGKASPGIVIDRSGKEHVGGLVPSVLALEAFSTNPLLGWKLYIISTIIRQSASLLRAHTEAIPSFKYYTNNAPSFQNGKHSSRVGEGDSFDHTESCPAI